MDKRSGVSQRLPISAWKTWSPTPSAAPCCRIEYVVPRVSDIYAAMPSITGKLELEYEGEMKGADHVVREIIRSAVASVFDQYFPDADMKQIVQWFDLGGEIQLRRRRSRRGAAHAEWHTGTCSTNVRLWAWSSQEKPEVRSAAEFVLEGLCAHKRIGRNEERVFTAGEKGPKRRSGNTNRSPGRREELRRNAGRTTESGSSFLVLVKVSGREGFRFQP